MKYSEVRWNKRNPKKQVQARRDAWHNGWHMDEMIRKIYEATKRRQNRVEKPEQKNQSKETNQIDQKKHRK